MITEVLVGWGVDCYAPIMAVTVYGLLCLQVDTRLDRTLCTVSFLLRVVL